MSRTALIIARKVTVVICGVLVIYWAAFLGCVVYFSFDSGRFWVMQFLREVDDASAGRAWNPVHFMITQGLYFVATAISGALAVYFRRQIEASPLA